MLVQHRGPKSRSSLEVVPTASAEDGAPPVLVLPSSTELFYFYAQTLEQCAALFTGQPLFDLCTLHKKWLRIYAGSVDFFCVSYLVLICLVAEDVLMTTFKRSARIQLLCLIRR